MTKNVIYLISFLICSIVTQAQTTAWDGTIATKLVNTGSGTGAEDSPIEKAYLTEMKKRSVIWLPLVPVIIMPVYSGV